MTGNPYRWQHDQPEHVVARGVLVGTVEAHLRRGVVVKLVGGRGMGKSVLLRQVQARFADEPDTRAVHVPGPPEEGTLAACVGDLAARLGIASLPRISMDAVIEAAMAQGIQRIILLLDEADQYVLLGPTGEFARAWFNRIEALRKSWTDRVAVVIGGGLGILHVAHVLGSGLLSRAETCVVDPFDREELRQLAAPLGNRRGQLSDEALETLATLSGGSPALATYGLERLYEEGGDPVQVLRAEFGAFPSRHGDFLRAVQDGVSHRGLVASPGRVLALVRASAGSISQHDLRAACAADDPPVDVAQAVQLLQAAGLVRVAGSVHADPLQAHAVASIINLPTSPAVGADPTARLLADVAAVLGQMHRFGRDFHGKKDLIDEQVFCSLLAVGLVSLGWSDVDRESVQAAGYPDLRVRLTQSGLPGHVLIETKIWPRNDYREIQQQLDAYRVADTVLSVGVMLGARDEAGWADDYERECLAGRTFVRQPTPPDLVGRWSIESTDAAGRRIVTEHLLVRIPKRG